MSTLTITIPSSDSVTAAEVVTAAARRAGHTERHTADAEAFLAGHLAEHVHQLYKSAMVDAEVSRVEVAVPRPESPSLRAESVQPAEGSTVPGRGDPVTNPPRLPAGARWDPVLACHSGSDRESLSSSKGPADE